MVVPAVAAQISVHPQFCNLTILTCRMWTTVVLGGHLPPAPIQSNGKRMEPRTTKGGLPALGFTSILSSH